MEIVEDLGRTIKKQMSILKCKYNVEVKCSVKLSTKEIKVKIENLPLLLATNKGLREEEEKLQAKIRLVDNSYKVIFMDDKK